MISFTTRFLSVLLVLIQSFHLLSADLSFTEENGITVILESVNNISSGSIKPEYRFHVMSDSGTEKSITIDDFIINGNIHVAGYAYVSLNEDVQEAYDTLPGSVNQAIRKYGSNEGVSLQYTIHAREKNSETQQYDLICERTETVDNLKPAGYSNPGSFSEKTLAPRQTLIDSDDIHFELLYSYSANDNLYLYFLLGNRSDELVNFDIAGIELNSVFGEDFGSRYDLEKGQSAILYFNTPLNNYSVDEITDIYSLSVMAGYSKPDISRYKSDEIRCQVQLYNRNNGSDVFDPGEIFFDDAGIRVGYLGQDMWHDDYRWLFTVENSNDEPVTVCIYDVCFDGVPEKYLLYEYVVGNESKMYLKISDWNYDLPVRPEIRFKVMIFDKHRNKILYSSDKYYTFAPEI